MSRIAKSARIRKGYEFRDIYKHGKVFSSNQLLLFVINNDLNYPRYGLSVSRKIGGAVVRNRIKRLLREIMREILNDIDGGSDLVFVARQGIKNIGFGELKDIVRGLILRSANKGALRATCK